MPQLRSMCSAPRRIIESDACYVSLDAVRWIMESGRRRGENEIGRVRERGRMKLA